MSNSLEIWRAECQAQQHVDEESSQQVNEQVDRVKTGDVETPEVVIEGKGQIGDVSVRQECISATIGIEVIQAFDNPILGN